MRRKERAYARSSDLGSATTQCDRGRDVPIPIEYSATLHRPRAHEQLKTRATGIKLEILSGTGTGEVFHFDLVGDKERTDRLVGGRNLCDIELRDNSVSQRHFELSFAGTGVRLRDLDSTNGTWIGRARIRDALLAPGIEFFAGDCCIRVVDIEVQDLAVSTRDGLGTMLGVDEASRVLFSTVERVAPTAMTVLIMGESGTGKGEVARTIHAKSKRPGPFRLLDCSTLPNELAAGLVLGHAKGAYTGATSDRPSPFEEADGGTIFIDEIGELPLEVQKSLLTVVDRGELQRVGETRIRKVNARIVAATNRDLGAEVTAGRFRKDLYYRLREFVMTVEPLRARRADIPFLAEHFLEGFGKKIGRSLCLDPDAKQYLSQLLWDGNVRQLRAVMRRTAHFSTQDIVSRSEIQLFDDEVETSSPSTGTDVPSGGMKAALVHYTTQYCERIMRSANGSLEVAAAEARYSERGLRQLLARHGLSHLIETARE